MFMETSKPLSPIYPFYTTPAHKDPTLNMTASELAAHRASEQGLPPPPVFELKEEIQNLMDDEIRFTIFNESDFKKTTYSEDGDQGANDFVPQFLNVESIHFKDGKMTISFKDSDKKYSRNLSNVRLYNHNDPDPEDDEPEEVNGAIFDALNF